MHNASTSPWAAPSSPFPGQAKKPWEPISSSEAEFAAGGAKDIAESCVQIGLGNTFAVVIIQAAILPQTKVF